MRLPCDLRRQLMLSLAVMPGLFGCSSSEGLGGGIHMDPIRGAVELEGIHRDETYFGSGTGQPKNHVKENRIRGSLKLDLKGDVYHPSLMTYRAILDLGYEQVQSQSGAATQKTRVSNDYFDIRGDFFKEQPYSADLYAFRTQIETRQSFFATSDAVVLEAGANARAREWIVPSTLSYRHRDYEGRIGDTRKEVRDTLYLQGGTRDDVLSLAYRLEFNAIETNTVPEPYEDYQMWTNLSSNFGENREHLVGAGAGYRQQTGLFSNQMSNMNGFLRMALTDSLEWDSKVNFERTIFGENQGIPIKQIRWNSYLEHRLFDSLISGAGIDGTDQFFGDGEMLRNGVRMSFDYRKKTGVGILTASLSPVGYIQEESGNPDRLVPVVNEGHRYTIGVPIFLDNLGVDASTILVTDSLGLTIYDDPADYVVRQVGQTTEILPSIGGRILPGDTILVSYRYFVGSDRKFRSLANQTSVSMDFGQHATVGMFWGISRQTLLEGVDDDTLEDVDGIGVNAMLRQGRHYLRYDFLNRNSTFTPVRRHSLDARLSFLPAMNVSMDFNGGLFRTLHKDTGLVEWGLSAGGMGNWRLADRLRFVLSARFRRIDYNSDQGRGWYLDSSLRYDLGRTFLVLRVMGSQERWEVQNDNNLFRVYFSVRRDF